MKIIVFIKQVPDTNELRIDPETGNLIREGVPSIVNPEDKHAVEAAVVIKEKHGGKITVVTMGPSQAEEALRECLAMGADEAILLSDRAFSGADTAATSYTLGIAARKIGEFDLILCGREALDGNTAQVGPQLAEFLELPQATYVQAVEVNGDTLKVKRALEDGYEVLETKLPALLTITKDINVPRTPAIDAVMDAYQKEIVTWTADDLPVDGGKIGLKGSPTRIRKAYTPELKGGWVEMIDGALDKAVQTLVARLREKQLV
ncbi:MAG: electron transfer flavoprotein subunit beta/FixA family protein [Dehalococcoidia bacterium]